MSWLRSNSSVSAALVLAAAGLVAIGGMSVAQEHTGPGHAGHEHAAPAGHTPACAAFKWPIEQDRAAFERSDIGKVNSGASGIVWAEQVVAVTLRPAKDVTFAAAPPEKKNPPDSFAGTVGFSPPAAAGAYQVTISNHSWVDLVQQDAALEAVDHSGAKGCDGVRKSIRFDVGAGPVTLQITGSPDEVVKVSIRPVQPG